MAAPGCTLFAPSPTTTTPAPVTPQWTFTVVRHAERADDGTDDPPLTEAGTDRAARLALRLEPQRGVAVYASPFRRAQSTAEPTAAAWGVPITTYPATTSPAEVAASALHDNLRGSILIVGHSDTVPGIVSALCACPVNPIPEDQFGNLYTVVIGTNHQVLTKLQTLNY